jgi:hypothetical protein
MYTKPAFAAGAALLAAVATTEPARAEPVVTIVEVQSPWYAPDFLVRSKMRETEPLYEALPGLLFKYFTIAENGKYGGIYLWRDAATAKAWYSEAWFAEVLRKRGAPADVRFFQLREAKDAVPHGVPRDDHSDAFVTLLTSSNPAGDNDVAPGLLRRYDVRGADGRPARIDLWSDRRSAETYYDEGRLGRLRTALGGVSVERFAAPILLPSSLPENRNPGTR